MEIPSDFVVKSSAKLGTKNAWALYARRRWPANGVKLSMAEWGLTEGEAKGLFAAQVSQPTIDKIIDHPRGGFGLGLLILEIRTQTALTDFIATEKARHAAARKELEQREQRLVAMARDLPAGLGLGGRGAGRAADRRRGEGGSRRG